MLLNLSSDYHIIAESPLTAAYIAAGSQSQVTAANVSTPTVAAHRRFLPLLAQARRIGSFLFLAKILVLFLSFPPLSFLLHSAPRALRRAASCVRLSRAAPRAYSLCGPVRSCAARNRSARETRAWRRAFLRLILARNRRRLSHYRRHAQRWRRSSCSAPYSHPALPAQV